MVTDTLAIKVSVPQVLGSYPEIDIKIDSTYVPHGDIYFDSSDSLWTYDWVLSGVSSDPAGKRHSVRAEISGDPKWADLSSIFTVEAVFDEDFETITDLIAEGWSLHKEEDLPNSKIPWEIWANPTNTNEKSVRSVTGFTYSQSYRLLSPNITIPDSSENKTKLEFDIYWDYSGSLWSNLYFEVCNTAGNPIGDRILLPKFYRTWWTYTYDLSKYSGQTIKIRWDNYHDFDPDYVIFTKYCLDDIVVYAIPDMDSPNIDFVYGNQAELDEDMILNLEFNDLSGIGDVTADYEIEGDTDTITLLPVKNTYNYTGTITARDHECIGDIVFKVKDSVGNETISSSYNIGWSNSTQILTAPENLLITMVNDSTVTLDWDIVGGASEYKVYTSEDPYGTFTLDTLGTFTTSTQWQKNSNTDKLFYYIVAANSSKKRKPVKEIEFMKIKGNRKNK